MEASKFCIAFVVLVWNMNQVTSKCQISDETEKGFVAAFQKINDQYFQMPESKEINLDTDNIVYLLCPGGFR